MSHWHENICEKYAHDDSPGINGMNVREGYVQHLCYHSNIKTCSVVPIITLEIKTQLPSFMA